MIVIIFRCGGLLFIKTDCPGDHCFFLFASLGAALLVLMRELKSAEKPAGVQPRHETRQNNFSRTESRQFGLRMSFNSKGGLSKSFRYKSRMIVALIGASLSVRP